VGRNRAGLSRERWEYIKALRPNPGRLVHLSKDLPHWRNDTAPGTEKTIRTWIADPVGVTFFDFRNARKAAYREDARRSA